MLVIGGALIGAILGGLTARRQNGAKLDIAQYAAAYAIARGDGSEALRQIDPYLDVAARSENAALLATLMLLKAEALDQTGQTEAARTVRLDSVGWARYGFGTDWAVRAKMQEIASLNPQNKRNSQSNG